MELARRILETSKRSWILVDLHVPKSLLLDALFVCPEVVHQIFDFFDFGISVSVHDHGKILHEAEVGTHGISQASQLTKLRYEGDLVTCASVLVDQQWLIHVGDVFVVSSSVVLLVAGWSPVLVEGGCWTLSEVDPIDLVGLLVVSSDHSRTSECFLDSCLAIASALLGFVTQVVHVVQTIVCPNNFEADVDVEKDA